MKIKILRYLPYSETGMMIDLQAGEIIAVDDTVAKILVDAGKAEYEI